jgi:hypothetical protein
MTPREPAKTPYNYIYIVTRALTEDLFTLFRESCYDPESSASACADGAWAEDEPDG